MGLLRRIGLIVVLAVLVILFAPGIPPHDTKFEAFNLTPALPLEGVLASNSILDKAEEVQLDRPIIGPESVAIRGEELYTGISGGELVRIKNGKVSTIARIGKTCEGLWDIRNCGRIAGVRFGPDGKLIVADAAYGIFKVDVDTGSVEPLVTLGKPIDGKKPMFPDDIDVGKDGSIYWSDASTKADIGNLLVELLGEPSGRLVKYDPATKTNTVLISGLHFANGVQLSANEDFVLVTETARARVMRHYIKGDKKGRTDVFVDGLPGLPDNVRPNGKGGFYIVLASPRITSETSLIDLLGSLPLVRKFIARTYVLLVSSLKSAESLIPGAVFREWIAYIEHFGALGDLETMPYKSIIIETDTTGKIIGSLQNERGPVTGLSQITTSSKWAYLGSPAQRKFYKIRADYL